MLFLHPFGYFPFPVFSVGCCFWTKQSRKSLWFGFCFSVIVLSSAVLDENYSELNGCTKTITFEHPLCRMRLWRVRWMHLNRYICNSPDVLSSAVSDCFGTLRRVLVACRLLIHSFILLPVMRLGLQACVTIGCRSLCS